MGGKALDGRKLPLDEAKGIGDALLASMEEEGAIVRGILAGSIRRKKPEVGDVDILVIRGPNYDRWLADRGGSGGEELSKLLVNDVQVDILSTDEGGWGASLMHLTGPKGRNIAQRAHAKRKGFRLNEKGLEKGKARLECSVDERSIYEFLGMTWREPEDR